MKDHVNEFNTGPINKYAPDIFHMYILFKC